MGITSQISSLIQTKEERTMGITSHTSPTKNKQRDNIRVYIKSRNPRVGRADGHCRGHPASQVASCLRPKEMAAKQNLEPGGAARNGLQ